MNHSPKGQEGQEYVGLDVKAETRKEVDNNARPFAFAIKIATQLALWFFLWYQRVKTKELLLWPFGFSLFSLVFTLAFGPPYRVEAAGKAKDKSKDRLAAEKQRV